MSHFLFDKGEKNRAIRAVRKPHQRRGKRQIRRGTEREREIEKRTKKES